MPRASSAARQPFIRHWLDSDSFLPEMKYTFLCPRFKKYSHAMRAPPSWSSLTVEQVGCSIGVIITVLRVLRCLKGIKVIDHLTQVEDHAVNEAAATSYAQHRQGSSSPPSAF